MDKTQKVLKILGIITACLICLCCLGVDAWWICVYKYGANKVEDNVIYADDIKATDGTTANIFEVNYKSNLNGNGVEMFELKISGLTDTNSSAIYSQGIQYVADESDTKIRWNYMDKNGMSLNDLYNLSYLNEAKNGNYTHLSEANYSAINSMTANDNNSYNYKKHNAFIGTEDRAVFQKLNILSGASRYNYASSDNFANDVGAAVNPVNDSTFFRIQLKEKNEDGEEVLVPYAFKFRGDRTVEELLNGEEKPLYSINAAHNTFLYTCYDKINVFPYYNIDFLASRIYEKVKSMPAGSNQYTLVELGDWLDYYSVGKDSTLVEDRLSVDKTNKVRTMFTSYYAIKITVSADGAQKASDSMFKTIHGSANFNIAPEGVSNGDYFYGRSVVTIGLNAFDGVETEDGYKLKLKQSFLKQYLPNKKLIVVNVVIDKDELAKTNKTFAGFAENSGLENFALQHCYTIETKNGVRVKSEVAL